MFECLICGFCTDNIYELSYHETSHTLDTAKMAATFEHNNKLIYLKGN